MVPVAPFAQKKSSETRTLFPAKNLKSVMESRAFSSVSREYQIPIGVSSPMGKVATFCPQVHHGRLHTNNRILATIAISSECRMEHFQGWRCP